MVLAAAVAAVDLLLLLPVGLDARYTGEGLSLRILAGPVPLGRAANRRPAAGRCRTGHGPGRIPRPVLWRTVRRCGARAKSFLRRVRVRTLRLHFTAGGDDPCRTAMAYAGAGLVLEGIGRLAAEHAETAELRASARFDGGPSAVSGEVELTARLGTLLWAAACFGTALLREYFRYHAKGRDDRWQNKRWAS